MYEGVGLLGLASEAATQMGGVRITACDSGVVRSMMSLTLEQTALLARCHALPQKGLRTVMNKFREVSGRGSGGWGRGRWEEEVCVVAIYIALLLCPLSQPLPQGKLVILEKKNVVRVRNAFSSEPPRYGCISWSHFKSCDQHVTQRIYVWHTCKL